MHWLRAYERGACVKKEKAKRKYEENPCNMQFTILELGLQKDTRAIDESEKTTDGERAE